MNKTGKIMAFVVVFVLLFAIGVSCNKNNKTSESENNSITESVSDIQNESKKNSEKESENDSESNGVTESEDENTSESVAVSESVGESESEIVYADGLEYELNSDGESYSVVGIGSFVGNDLNIPKEYNEKPVTAIGKQAFYGCMSVVDVVIPEGVTTIGDEAFCYCYNLASVVIPKGVVTIEDNAFYTCYSLGNVTLPEGVVSIGSAFSGCNKLTEFVIPDSVTEISRDAFENCYGLTSVTIGSGVKSIGDGAFAYSPKLVEVINKSDINIERGSDENGGVGSYALAIHNGESIIDNVDGYRFMISDGVDYLVGYTGNEKNITLPESYNGKRYEVYKYAFFGSFTLNKVIIGSGVNNIGEYAFHDCFGLTSVTIGENVDNIDERAFAECYKLVEVINRSNLIIEKGSEDNGFIGYYALNIHNGESVIDCVDDYLFMVDDGVNYLLGYIGSDKKLILPESYKGEKYEIYKCSFTGQFSFTSVDISDGVTCIGEQAFMMCCAIENVSIGKSVAKIGSIVFGNCVSLVRIKYDGTTAQWNDISKGTHWDDTTGNYTVYCTDGNIAKS